jgi:NAD(P)-dependent dehydrogenase (short-subunit alcohol dehydrogenase family)
MAAMLSKSFPPFIGMAPEEVFRKRVELMIPMGKPQTAEGVGNAVVFLASREADEITGQALNVDGGAFFS